MAKKEYMTAETAARLLDNGQNALYDVAVSYRISNNEILAIEAIIHGAERIESEILKRMQREREEMKKKIADIESGHNDIIVKMAADFQQLENEHNDLLLNPQVIYKDREVIKEVEKIVFYNDLPEPAPPTMAERIRSAIERWERVKI